MTFYEVNISSPNLAGQASGMKALIMAMKVVENYFKLDQARNAPWCPECSHRPYPDVPSEVYHVFLIRERPALEIVAGADFLWRKKRGIGRQSQLQYLESLVESGNEEWFQLELSEF